MEKRINKTFRPASCLLAADRLRNSLKGEAAIVYPASIGVLNLFFCAYFERFLKNDTGALYLALFLFLESSVYLLMAVAYFMGSTTEFLSKTRIFPTTPSSRILFASLSNIRRAPCGALVASNIFFMLVFYRNSPLAMIAAPILFLLMILNIETVSTIILLVSARISRPLAGVAALVALCAFAVPVSSLVFHFDTLLTALPVISWATSGIHSAAQGALSPAVTMGGLLAALPIAVVVIGARFC